MRSLVKKLFNFVELNDVLSAASGVEGLVHYRCDYCGEAKINYYIDDNYLVRNNSCLCSPSEPRKATIADIKSMFIEVGNK